MTQRDLTITLCCQTCGVTQPVKPYLRLTKLGVLRLEASACGFYVDGERVLCRAHRLHPEPMAQRATWEDEMGGES